MPFRLRQCPAVYPETTESPGSHKPVTDKLNLLELPLPNAKSWLFGDDFPSLASKQAELSKGLTKYLAQATGKYYSTDSISSQSQSKHRGDTFNKYQFTGYSNLSKSQNSKGFLQNTFFLSSHCQEGTSARLSECIEP